MPETFQSRAAKVSHLRDGIDRELSVSLKTQNKLAVQTNFTTRQFLPSQEPRGYCSREKDSGPRIAHLCIDLTVATCHIQYTFLVLSL